MAPKTTLSGVSRTILAELRKCEPFSQILVSDLWPRSTVGVVYAECTSAADFLVHVSLQAVDFKGQPWEYLVEREKRFVRSNSPVFIVGGVSGDVIKITVQSPGFVTLQTRCTAKASITLTYQN